MPRLRGAHAAHRDPVRPARPGVRLPLLRNPRHAQRRLGARGHGGGRADPGARAAARGRRDARPARRAARRGPVLGPGQARRRRWASGSSSTAPTSRPGPSACSARRREDERPRLAVAPRIGITKAADLPWRFCAAGQPVRLATAARARGQAQLRRAPRRRWRPSRRWYRRRAATGVAAASAAARVACRRRRCRRRRSCRRHRCRRRRRPPEPTRLAGVPAGPGGVAAPARAGLRLALRAAAAGVLRRGVGLALALGLRGQALVDRRCRRRR